MKKKKEILSKKKSNGIKRCVSGSFPIDWKKLRDEFFKDNTRTRTMGITGDLEMTEFKTIPHNVFEWFKAKINRQ